MVVVLVVCALIFARVGVAVRKVTITIVIHDAYLARLSANYLRVSWRGKSEGLGTRTGDLSL